MQTQRTTKILPAANPLQDRPALRQAAAVLRAGGLVVFPTETVYGIGANALDGAAVEQIFRAKGRPQDNPLIVHIAHSGDLDHLVRRVPPVARELMARFWPGPLTMIFPADPQVPRQVSAGLDTVAVRMPSHPVARELIALAGVPVAAPSANRSGSPSPTTAQHCIDDLSGRVDVILDGGSCPVGVESTVITLAGDTPRLLRPGAVTAEQLREVAGVVEVDDAVFHEVTGDAPVASPGMKYRHYSPRVPVHLVHGSFAQFHAFVSENMADGVWALAFEEDCGRLPCPCVPYGRENDSASQAQGLFAALRELDRQGARQVYARAPSGTGVGLAVYNRLYRASSKKIFLGSGTGYE